MSPVGGELLSDLLHPNDQGYANMARRWRDAISEIPSQWWSAPSSSRASGSVQTCARDQISFTPALNGNFVAHGAHVEGDTPEGGASTAPSGNTFQPGWADDGVVAIGVGRPGAGVQFADLDGDGRKDYIWADASDGSVRAWLNKGRATWIPVNNGDKIAWGTGTTSYVEFADLTGDKRAEYIVVSNGAFRVFQNNGPNGEVWLWRELVNAGKQLTNLFPGGTAGYHYFGDLNGDGLADLAIVNPNGVIDIYFNQGLNGDGFGWTPCLNKGILAPQMVLTDIDGDGKSKHTLLLHQTHTDYHVRQGRLSFH
jgi:hypothetical protein